MVLARSAADQTLRSNYGEGNAFFNWNTPIALSPNEKRTIYIGAQFLFRSRDHGRTWDRISPDLTTNDPEKQKQEQSGGVTVDNSSAEMHTTIYSISESPKDKSLIWVGTDDGNLQLTRDGGKTWTNVVGNIPGLPKNSWVAGCRRATSTPAPLTRRLIDIPLAIWGHMFSKRLITVRLGRRLSPLKTPKAFEDTLM